MPTLLFDDDEADPQLLSDQGTHPVDAASGPARGQLRRDIAKLASGADAAIRSYASDPVQGTIRLAGDLAVGAAAGIPRAAYQIHDLYQDATDFVIGQPAKLLGKEQVEAVIRRNDADRAERIAALRPHDDEPLQGFVSDLSEQLAAAYIGGALARGVGARGLAATGVGSIFAGGVAGKTTSDQLVKEGVDPLTAGLAGLQSAAINAAGAAAPGSLGGKLISRLGSGALLNSGFGIADRVATANLLKQNGYVEQAQSFEALAPEALALDLILGAGFAALDAHGRSTDTRFAAQFGRDPSPEELDAAVHQIAIRDAQRSPIGVGLNGIAITAHERALERAIQQAASDEPINVGEFFEPRLRLGEDGPDELLDLAASERDNGRDFEAAALARLAQLRGAPIDTTGPYIEAARSLSREDQQASFDADLEARARDLDRETIAPDFLEIDRVEIDEAIQRVVHALHGDPEFRQIINDLSKQTIDPDDQTLIDLFRIQQRDGRDELLGSARKARDLPFRVQGHAWEARGYEPRDVILNFNDGLPPGESAIILGLDPERSDVRNTIKLQESDIRAHVRAYVEEGGDKLNELADAWSLAPDQIIDFVRNSGIRRAPSIVGHARALIRSGLTDSVKIRKRLLEYADVYRLDLKPSSIRVLISQAKRKVALEAQQRAERRLLGSTRVTENQALDVEKQVDGSGSEDRGSAAADPVGTGNPGGSGAALVERGARIRAALEEFGTGTSLVDSGYILPDGKLLKVPPGEHASVYIALDEAAQTNPIEAMLEDGAIRVNSLGASLAYLPTSRQLAKLVSEWNRTFGRDYPMAIEIVDPATQSVLVGERFNRVNLETISEWLEKHASRFSAENAGSSGKLLSSAKKIEIRTERSGENYKFKGPQGAVLRARAVARQRVLKIDSAFVDQNIRDTGTGLALYIEALRTANSLGRILVSDVTVSNDAAVIYAALARRGYRVLRARDTLRIGEARQGAGTGPLFAILPPGDERTWRDVIADYYGIDKETIPAGLADEAIEVPVLSREEYERLSPGERDLIASQGEFEKNPSTQTPYAAIERLKADLERSFGLSPEATERLIDSGRLSIFETAVHAETVLGRSVGNVAGGYLPNSDRAFLIADRVAPDQAYRVVLHEVGVHAGIVGLLGETRWTQLQGVLRGMVPQALIEGTHFRDLVTTLRHAGERNDSLIANEVARLAQQHDLNPEIVQAWAEAEAFAVKGYEAEEALAYLVENAPDLPIVRRLLAQIRQWLWRTFGPDFGPRLTIDDLQALAVAALKREGRLAERNRLAAEVRDIDLNALASARSAGYEGGDTGEAYEWLRAKAKGLDMSAPARMARAQQMGFTTPAFHGTDEDISAFNPNRGGTHMNSLKGTPPASYFSSNPKVSALYASSTARDNIPVEETRAAYAAVSKNILDQFFPDQTAALEYFLDLKFPGLKKKLNLSKETRFDKEVDKLITGAQIYPVFIRVGNSYQVHVEGYNPHVWDQHLSDASFHKYDSVVFLNTNDTPGGENIIGDTIAVFNPANVRSIFAAFDPDYAEDASLLASFANAYTPDQRARLGKELESRADGNRHLYIWGLKDQTFALALTGRTDLKETKSDAPVRVSFGELREGDTLDIERQNFGELVQAEQNIQFVLAGIERDIREHQRASYVFVARDARLERLYAHLAARLILPEGYVLAKRAEVFAIIRADEVARTLGGIDGALDSAIIQTTQPVESRVRTRSEADDLRAAARGDLRLHEQDPQTPDLNAAHEIARDDPELEIPLSEFGSPQPFRAREVMQLLALQRRAGDQLEPAFDVAAACALRNGWGDADKNAPFTLIDHPRVQGLLVSQILVLSGGTPLGLMFWEALFLNGQTDVPSPRIAGEREDYRNYLKKSEIQRNPGFRREEPISNPIPSRSQLERQKASNLALVDTDQPLADLAIEAGEIVGFDGKWLEKLALKESGGDIDAQPIDPDSGKPLSSAIGLTQFIESTWIDIMKKYGASHGFHGDLRNEDVQQRALALRTNPIWSLVMAGHLAKDNAQALRNSLGRDATERELYLAHFAGIDGALTLIQADGEELGATIMGSEAASNPALYYDSEGSPRTIGQIRERLGKSFASVSPENERAG